MSQWIWHFGEFEIYHNMMLHTRRMEYGHPEPPVWKVYAPEPVILFSKKGITDGGSVRITACGEYCAKVTREDGVTENYGKNRELVLQPGDYLLEIRVMNTDTFPALYVEGAVESDATWLSDDFSANLRAVGTSELFTDRDARPDVFPFAYEPVSFVSKEMVDGGVLFDFGKETFARVRLDGLNELDGLDGSDDLNELDRLDGRNGLTGDRVIVRYGESREEALDPQWAVIRFEDTPENGTLSYPAYAFRYLFVSDANAKVSAEYEYLPLPYRGSFSCEDDLINRIWKMAAYTFHLNSREFFLDGIKRDRWVWSGDAYQSLFVNHYLFFDPEIEKRTLTALGGKRPFVRHINKINDYTFLWVMSIYEYYRTYGDRTYLEQIKPQLDEVMKFCMGRADVDGFVRAREGDWIFIDWADIDREGALCGEQILYAKALECYAYLCGVLGEDAGGLNEQAQALQEKIQRYFYDDEKKVFIDSYESGRRHVTRHCNLLAYLYLPCGGEQKKEIYQRVILNDAVPQITTPYFKFFENQVHCMEGNMKYLEDSVRDYYGGMLQAGATTLFEEFDPTQKGAEHYAMYGHPYEKSLCHAWSTSPIYLFGAYLLGVQNTGVAHDTFEVRPYLGGMNCFSRKVPAPGGMNCFSGKAPAPGGMKCFSGTVPVPGGYVRVQADEASLRVTADIDGGTLWAYGKSYPLQAGVEKVIERKEGMQ
ncbi:MAG: hypothetical protein LUG99_19550 [Lachnospiraceae bacterium]|nr:hypothetical protein [Lachnospiraceae bacterium]